MAESTIIAGDIGGTHTRLSLLRTDGRALTPVRTEIYDSRSGKDLAELLDRFLHAGTEAEREAGIAAATFGVAGPVIDGRCVATNLPWVLDERELGEFLRCPRTRLLNDLQALAFGVLFLPPEQLVSLNGIPPPRRGNAAVIAAGTGLGEAYLWWDGARCHPAASEGSHAELAPRTPLQLELCGYLIKRLGHVSYERVVSGPAFSVLYDFLRDAGHEEAPAWLEEALSKGDRNALISELGLSRKAPICARALDLFVEIYGAEAGNMALRAVATGGVYVGGGIAPKILPKLQDGAFMAAFKAKGRFEAFCSQIPVNVILGEQTGLLGASHFARALLEG